MKTQISRGRFTRNHLFIILLAALIGIQVFISNKISTSGERLRYLEQRALELEEENQKILAQNIDTISIHELSLKAVELGFIEPKEIINFNTSNKIALNQ